MTTVQVQSSRQLEQTSVTQWPLPIRDFLVSSSPSVLMMMSLEAWIRIFLNNLRSSMARRTASIRTSVRFLFSSGRVGNGSRLKYCFTSTENTGLLGMGAEDGHLDIHTVPELCDGSWWWCRASCPRMSVDILGTNCDQCLYRPHSSGAVWESRWPSWAVRPNEPSGFRGRKAILSHASALVSACP